MRSPCIAAFEPVSSGCHFGKSFPSASRRYAQVCGSHSNVAALAGFDVQLPAGDVGEIDFVGIFIHQFMQTALSAAVAQRLPLRVGHFVERFALPERDVVHRDVHTSKESAPYNESGTMMQVLPSIKGGKMILQHAGFQRQAVKTDVQLISAAERANAFRRTGEDHIARFKGEKAAHVGNQRNDFVDHIRR